MGAAKLPFSPGFVGRGVLGMPRSVVRQRSSGRQLLAWQCVALRARGACARGCPLVLASRVKGQFFADA